MMTSAMSPALTVIGWIIVVSALGWAVWPLAFRLLPGLPDRGYTLSRALGLLLTGYVFWLLGMLGFLANTTGAMLFSALLVLGLSIWVYRSRPEPSDTLGGWLQTNRRFVLTAELLFLAAFVGWAVVRAYNPDIAGTEKPMELAFLNGVRRSPAFPPQDPWLAGYGISYYYFGYVLIAMLADLTGTATAVAFNLGIALLFSLTVLGSYGLVASLIAVRRREQEASAGMAIGMPLLGPLLVGVAGNLGGFLELLRAFNLRLLGAGFWRWIDLQDLSEPAGRVLWPLSTWRHWWWWRASRVIHDRDAAGVSSGLQPIDEFPFFSFLLGDMHPHVLALPFVLLALALAFNVLAEHETLGRRLRLAQFGLYVLVFGGLAFLNTWDLPIYWFVLVGALAVRRIRQRGWFAASDLTRPVLTGLAVLLLGLLAYLPWITSFDSQAGGILPNPVFATRLHQFVIMFGPLLIIAIWFVIDRAAARRGQTDWPAGLLLGGGLLITLIAAAGALSLAALRANPAAQAFAVSSAGLPVEGQTPEGIAALLPQAARLIAQHRLLHPLTPLVLTALIAAALAVLLPRPPAGDDASRRPEPFSAATGFALLLILTGGLLTLGPEFVYLRDNFGQRLNTIFKFYYAAWILWAVAAAYAAHVLTAGRRPAGRAALALLLAILIAPGLVYPALAIPTKTGFFGRAGGQPPPTLNGIEYIRVQYPDEYRAMQWLDANAGPDAILLEAVGGAYSYHARFSTVTGVPTLLGWPNHERQWRGARYAEMAGTREPDVREIYNTTSAPRALELLDHYRVTYVVVGLLERGQGYALPAGIAKFERVLTPVFQSGSVVIYRADLPRVEGGE